MKKIIAIIIAVATVISLAGCSKKEETVSYGKIWEVGSMEATLYTNRTGNEEDIEYITITSNVDSEHYNRFQRMYQNGRISLEDWFYLMFVDVLPEDAEIPPEYTF